MRPRAAIPPPRGPLVRATTPLVVVGGSTMGVSWSLKATGAAASAELIRTTVQDSLDQVVAQMSQWEIGSHITRFNTAVAGSRHRLPDDFALVLACALEIAELTGGAFDPTLGAVTELWGFGARQWAGARPSPEAARRARGQTGLDRLRLEADGHLTQPGGLRLDLSGIAKGFGVDKAAEALRRLGIDAFLLEVGGELRGQGLRPDGQPWWISIDAPRPSFRDEIRIALPGWSVATSGDYRRGYQADGRRLSHTFDPRTGEPVEARAVETVVSATVLDPSCMRADAFATALIVLGPEAGAAFAGRIGLPALMIIESRDGLRTLASAAWTELEA